MDQLGRGWGGGVAQGGVTAVFGSLDLHPDVSLRRCLFVFATFYIFLLFLVLQHCSLKYTCLPVYLSICLYIYLEIDIDIQGVPKSLTNIHRPILWAVLVEMTSDVLRRFRNRFSVNVFFVLCFQVAPFTPRERSPAAHTLTQLAQCVVSPALHILNTDEVAASQNLMMFNTTTVDLD